MKMKFIYTLFFFSLLNVCRSDSDSLRSKQIDRFRVHLDFSTSLSTFKLMGTSDVGDRSSTTIRNNVVTIAPDYKYVEERVTSLNVHMHFGFNVPLYRSKNWSTGIKTNAGFGYQYGGTGESFILDFPLYAYYRNYSGKIDYTIFAGYKYTLAPVSYGLFILGVDYNLTERQAIRFYFSPVRRTYYSQLTNGDLKPLVRVMEFGLGLIF